MKTLELHHLGARAGARHPIRDGSITTHSHLFQPRQVTSIHPASIMDAQTRCERLLSRHLQAQDLVFRCPPPCARASRQLTHHQRAQRDSSPPGHPTPCLTYSFVLCAAAGAPEVGAGGEGRASSSRSSVPPLRPGERRSHRGSASVALPRVSPRSALGTPLNHIEKALLHLLAGLLDLLEPDFASSRGARRMPRAQRFRAPEGEPAQASVSEPSHPPKHTPSPPPLIPPIPHVGRRPRGRERAAAASAAGRFFGLRPRAVEAAHDGRGGLVSP